MDLKTRVTPKQLQILQKYGITDIYSLITYQPLAIELIKPLTTFYPSKANTKYLANAKLDKIEQVFKPRRSFILHWKFENGRLLKTYFFSITKFTTATLKVGQAYQLLLNYQNNFWGLEKYSLLRDNLQSSKFVLGQNELREYMQTRYPQTQDLTNTIIKSALSRLDRQDFYLNLKGLVGAQSTIPQILDLYPLHFPTSIDQYNTALKNWLKLQIYLELATIKFYRDNKKLARAKVAIVNDEYLRRLKLSLKYKLSESQDKVLNNLLAQIHH